MGYGRMRFVMPEFQGQARQHPPGRRPGAVAAVAASIERYQAELKEQS